MSRHFQGSRRDPQTDPFGPYRHHHRPDALHAAKLAAWELAVGERPRQSHASRSPRRGDLPDVMQHGPSPPTLRARWSARLVSLARALLGAGHPAAAGAPVARLLPTAAPLQEPAQAPVAADAPAEPGAPAPADIPRAA